MFDVKSIRFLLPELNPLIYTNVEKYNQKYYIIKISKCKGKHIFQSFESSYEP